MINTVSASSNDWMVYGYVYLDNNIVLPNEVILTLPIRDYENILFLSGRYAIYFSEEPVGTIGTFSITIGDKEYTPDNNLIIEEGVSLYNVDLYVYTTGEEEPEDPTNIQPKADAGGPYYGTVNVEINLNGSDSFDSDGTISKYEWNFGDGTTKNGVIQTHTYDKVDDYRITLTVTDNKGKTDLDITYAYITEKPNKPPSQPITNGPTNSSANSETNYTFTSTDYDNDTIQYIIDWGDESDIVSSQFLTNYTTYFANHSWNYPGIYKLTAYARDENDASSQPTELTILINTIYCENLGYMIDYTIDDIYDLFYSNITGEETPVAQVDELYLIDYDNDGDYDYQFNITTMQISTYVEPVTNEEKSSLIDLITPFTIYILIFIIIILFLITGVLVYKIRTKSNKQKRKKIKNIEKKDAKKEEKRKKESVKSKEKIKRVEDEVDGLLSKKKK